MWKIKVEKIKKKLEIFFLKKLIIVVLRKVSKEVANTLHHKVFKGRMEKHIFPIITIAIEGVIH